MQMSLNPRETKTGRGSYGDVALEAASILHLLGRKKSALMLVKEIIEEQQLSVVEDNLELLARNHLSFAILCLNEVAGSDHEGLERCWGAISRGTSGRLMEPELLQARLQHVGGHGNAGACLAEARADICYVLSVSLPQDATGYSMRTQAVVPALQNHGLTVHCLTRPGFPWHRGLSGPAEPAQIGSVTYHRSGSEAHRIPSDFSSFYAAERELIDRLSELRPTAVMAASNHQTAIPALLAARRLGLPFIYDVRGFWEYSRLANHPGWGGSDGYRVACELEKLTARSSDLVLTLNAAMRDELMSRGVAPERICLFPNAADPARFFPRKRSRSLSERLQITPDIPVIGYIGSFNAYEGLEDLLFAGITLSRKGYDFRMILVGSDQGSDTGIFDSLHRQAEEAGISEKVILPGRIPAEDVAEWYSLIDISPLPRRSAEVTRKVPALKPLEAMAMGKCLVVPDLPPMIEIVQHGHSGMIYQQGCHDSLVETLAILIKDKDLRQRLGAEARRWVSQERNWSVASATAADRIKKLLAPVYSRQDCLR